MTEIEARGWLREANVPRETIDRLSHFVAMVIEEARHQNLVAASTLPAIWSRHIVDSAQLANLIAPEGTIVDIGTGAGFPGIVIALVLDREILMTEPRRRRAEFLMRAVKELGLSNASVQGSRVEAVAGFFSSITARAVATLDFILASSLHLAGENTRWVLPRGRSGAAEVEAARKTWHGRFSLVPSVSDPESSIVIATEIERKQDPSSRRSAMKHRR